MSERPAWRISVQNATSGVGEAGYQQSAPVDQNRDKAECQKHRHCRQPP